MEKALFPGGLFVGGAGGTVPVHESERECVCCEKDLLGPPGYGLCRLGSLDLVNWCGVALVKSVVVLCSGFSDAIW